MATIMLSSGGITMYLLYDAAVAEQMARLRDSARNHARLIEAIARHESWLAPPPGTATATTLAQVIDAHGRAEGFGRTGEYVLARIEGDQISFVLSHRHEDSADAEIQSLPVDGELAEPMHLALEGRSGTLIGTDYRGKRVLAAYEYVAGLDMGLVAKIDLAEIRAPFIRAALLGGGVGLLAIIVSALLFVRATIPLVKRVEESEAYSRAVIESAADGIMTVDHDERIIAINPACALIFGYTREQAAGMELADLIPSLSLATHGTADGIVMGTHSNGTQVPLEVSVSELPVHSGTQFSVFIRDVSERQRLEEELRHAHKMEAVGTLASGVAHDFNNLLMGISGSASVALKKCPPDSPVTGHLAEIKSAAVGGASITRQLLIFGRRGKATPTTLDLNSIVAGTERMLRRIVGEDIHVKVSLCSNTTRIRGDRGELEQILLNLAGNARHAMVSGGTLGLTTSEAALDGGDYILLTVSDTGVGMTDETKARIFEPFFTTKNAGSGTGLGLASTYAIVRRNGGHIEVDSTLGVGTTFRIFWPTTDDDVTTHAIALDGLRGDETILLVEDEPLVRQAIRHYLERSGYTVLEADDAEHALQVIVDHRGDIDLLLTDIVLPGKSGTELASALIELRPDVRVIFMSAYPTEKLVRDGHLEEETDSLQKPFTEETLLARVREVLGASARPGADNDLIRRSTDRTILFVEDHDTSRLTCCELLTDLGYNVVSAENGTDAVSACREHGDDIDLVVTDLGLPDMTCTAMLDELQGIIPNRAVIYMSGRSEHDPEVQRLLERPNTAFVEKPIDFDLVVATIEDLLSNPAAA